MPKDYRGNAVSVVKIHTNRQVIIFFVAARIHKQCILPKFESFCFEISHFSSTVTDVYELERRGHFYTAHFHWLIQWLLLYVFLRESNGMNKVWRSSIALSMNTEGGLWIYSGFAFEDGTLTKWAALCQRGSCGLGLTAVIRSSSVAHTRNTEMRSVLPPYKQIHDEFINLIQTFWKVYFLGN